MSAGSRPRRGLLAGLAETAARLAIFAGLAGMTMLVALKADLIAAGKGLPAAFPGPDEDLLMHSIAALALGAGGLWLIRARWRVVE